MKGAFILRQARADKGLTQAQLATILGVGIRTVARWEAGDSVPNATQLGALFILLGVGVTSFISQGGMNAMGRAWAALAPTVCDYGGTDER